MADQNVLNPIENPNSSGGFTAPPNPNSGAMPEQKPQGQRTLLIVLAVLLVLLLIVASMAVGYFISKSLVVSNSASNNSATPPLNDGQNAPVATVEAVTWNEPQPIASVKVFKDQIITGGMGGDYNPEKDAKYFKVGAVNDGQYQGGEIILVTAPINGPAINPGFYYFIKQGSSLVYLKKQSGDIYPELGLDESKFTVDSNYSLVDLEYSQTISGPGPRQTLQADPNIRAFFSLNNLKKEFTSPTLGDVFTTSGYDPTNADLFKRNGFYLKAPDGTVKVYSLRIDFLTGNSQPMITWSDGQQNASDYTYTEHTGCGSSNYASVMPTDVVSDSSLKITGKNSLGDNIYELIDSNHYLLKDLYDNKYQVMDGKKKMAYGAFIAGHPMFFWRDPFGRLIKFQNATYAPLAECGKPVIYLYPTQPGKISVQVEPQGGMTYSDPAYGNGWTVWSDTKSNLTELSSGKKYPYLFWEGRGGIYQQPQKGWVIKQAEVYQFLVDRLAQAGLNKKETADFIEFWEPRMQSAPYYFVTFLGTRDMDMIAPLTISPQPDTVIRVLMDFSPLSKPINVVGYDIVTPERRGFTVVEWGGVLR